MKKRIVLVCMFLLVAVNGFNVTPVLAAKKSADAATDVRESSAGALSGDKVSTDMSEYLIGPENVLQIDVYYGNGEKISQRVRVSSRGVINFPLIGEVKAVGYTVASLQNKLTELLEKDYLVNPQVTVFIEEYSTVSIMGEVKRPGAYPIKGQLSVVELISLAEGFTKIAAQNKVKVIHTKPDGTKEETTLKVHDFMSKNKIQKGNLILQAGDVVIVPESLF